MLQYLGALQTGVGLVNQVQANIAAQKAASQAAKTQNIATLLQALRPAPPAPLPAKQIPGAVMPAGTQRVGVPAVRGFDDVMPPPYLPTNTGESKDNTTMMIAAAAVIGLILFMKK